MRMRKCIFRSCTLTSKDYPQVHFFLFPGPGTPLHDKWVEMAGAEKTYQSHKVVCARHFRDEYFMNYFKKGLVRGKAVPTLMRISARQAYDYEQLDEDGKPMLVVLKPPQKKHLIVPPGMPDPLGFDEDDDGWEDVGGELSNEAESFIYDDNETTLIETEEPEEKKVEKRKASRSRRSAKSKKAKTDDEVPVQQPEFNNFESNEYLESEVVVQEVKSEQYAEYDSFSNSYQETLYSEQNESSNDPNIINMNTVPEPLDTNPNEITTDSNFISITMYNSMVEHYEKTLDEERNRSAEEMSLLRKANQCLFKELHEKKEAAKIVSVEQIKPLQNKNKKKGNDDLDQQFESLETKVLDKISEKNEILENCVQTVTAEVQKLSALLTHNQTFEEKYHNLLIDYNDIKAKYEILKSTFERTSTR